MALSKIIAVVLIALGVLGLVYGGFTYTRDTHEAAVGPISLSVQENERVTVPLWAGIAAVAVGGALLLYSSRFSR